MRTERINRLTMLAGATFTLLVAAATMPAAAAMAAPGEPAATTTTTAMLPAVTALPTQTDDARSTAAPTGAIVCGPLPHCVCVDPNGQPPVTLEDKCSSFTWPSSAHEDAPVARHGAVDLLVASKGAPQAKIFGPAA